MARQCVCTVIECRMYLFKGCFIKKCGLVLKAGFVLKGGYVLKGGFVLNLFCQFISQVTVFPCR